MKVCDGCFEEFKNSKGIYCENCLNDMLTLDKCGDIWKRLKSRGFKSKEEIEQYQSVKEFHKKYSKYELPKLKEEIIKCRTK